MIMRKAYFFLVLLTSFYYSHAQYCAAGSNSVADEYIGRVQLGTIDNDTSATTVAGYTDHTAISTDLTQGDTPTLTITPTWTGTIYPEGYGVWIDFNQDDDFADAGEFVFSQAATTTTPISTTLNIPLTATPGNTRMRIMMHYNTTPTNPCNNGYNFGETEDYTINIIALPPTPPDIDVQGNGTSIADGDVTPSLVDDTDFGSAVVSSATVVKTYTIENTGTSATDLTLSNPAVSLASGSSAEFTITAQPSDLILSAGETTTFQVTYTPVTLGTATATIEIANDDPDASEQTYSFDIQGNGIPTVPYPSGISTNLQLWLKADAGTTLTGTDVDAWADQSANAFTATSQGATDAQLITDGLNFNPVLRFTGAQYLNLGNPAALDLQPLTDEMTIITMVITGGATTGTVISKADNTTRNYQVWFGQTDRVLHHTLGRQGANTAERWGTIYALNEPKLTSGVIANTGDPFTRLTPYVNGVLDPADTNNGVSTGAVAADVLVGARRDAVNTGTGYLYNGDIAEIIIYDRDLTTVELNRVESYLALKYGITLGSNDAFWDTPTNTSSPFGYAGTSNDYLDSNGSTIWDGGMNAGYGYNVFGIARDDSSALMQTRSSSVNTAPSDVLTMEIESGSFGSDLSYLIVGNNGLGETIQTTTLPERTTGMLNKIWLARESATDVGTVQLEFDMSASGLSNLDDLELYVADDTSFSGYENYPGTNVGGVITFTGINLEDGQYFTLAEPVVITGSNGLFLDGVNDFVERANPPFAGLDEYTISCWMKNPGQADPSIRKDFMGQEDKIEFFLDGTGLFRQRVFSGSGSTASNGPIIFSFDDRWDHYAVTVSYSTNSAYYYINGNQYGFRLLSDNSIVDNNNPFRLGTFDNVDFFEGSIDEVKMFNVALTEDQIQKMVYQEIEQNGSNVRGKVIPLDVEDFSTGTDVTWNSLIAYYPMSTVTGNRLHDESSYDNFAFLKNITAMEAQTAPLPYESVADGNWEDDATWLHGTNWRTPGVSGAIFWPIVEIKSDVVINNNYSTLGVLIESGNTLTVSGTNPVVTNPDPLVVTNGTGRLLRNTWYLEIDGVLDLQGESGLLQEDTSVLGTSSAGYLEKDQQGTMDEYTYNYWSSPVSTINTTANNQPFSVSSVMMDGTTSSAPAAINWTSATYDGSPGPPISISSLWLYKFVNGADEDYDAWQFVGSGTNISPGEGYTMKGSGAGVINEQQNYVFRGKPNNGVISVSPLDDGNLYLVGNPYPSLLDANDFINQNLANGATTGTLYFWEHWGGGSHFLEGYQGGYATYTTMGGTPAMSHPSVDPTGSGTKTPYQYIPAGQGFFVQGDSNAGNGATATVEFNNSQRDGIFLDIGAFSGGIFFIAEQTGISTFLRAAEASDEIDVDSFRDRRQKIRLGYTNTAGFHRQLLLGFDENATDGIDLGLDGLAQDISGDDMYWSIAGDKYIIQAVQDLTQEREVPIGINADEAVSGTIMLDGLENIDDSIDIYLKDNTTNDYYNLRTSGHAISLPAGETNDKYSLVFRSGELLSVEDQTLDSGVLVYVDEYTNDVVIENKSGLAFEQIEIHTILGQRIIDRDTNLNSDRIRIPIQDQASGVYIVTVHSQQGKIAKKIVR